MAKNKIIAILTLVIMLLLGIIIGMMLGSKSSNDSTTDTLNTSTEAETEAEVETEIETEAETEESTESMDSATGSTTYAIDELDFGVGDGIAWEDGIFAPFADMTAWVTDATLSDGGTLDLGNVMSETGVQWYNLGFINAVDGTVTDGVLNWGFGGYQILSEEYGANDQQYQGIKNSIREIRENGGDVTISIGGLNERNFFQYTDDLDVLVNTYIEIIDGFNLTRIDLDIEGSAQGYENNQLNAEALQIVQEMTGVEIILTLPVLPTGLTSDLGLPTLTAYLEAGVDVKAVNIMAMCYGSYFGDYGPASCEAIDATMVQIQEEYSKIGITLSDAEAYNKLGVTTSIGFESAAHPTFTTEDSQMVVDYAYEKGVNFVSFWSLNRDTLTFANEGITTKYEHTPIYLAFENGDLSGNLEKVEASASAEYSPAQDKEVSIDDVAEWSREDEALGIYTPGVYVSYNGKLYKQVSEWTTWWCEPGTDSSVWEEQ